MRPGSVVVLQCLLFIVTADLASFENANLASFENADLQEVTLDNARRAGGTCVADLRCANVTRQGDGFEACFVSGSSSCCLPVIITVGVGACPILTVHIGAIHLVLLGLKVDTSPICLDVTAKAGTVLGDLLCGCGDAIAHGTLGVFLNSCSAAQIVSITAGLQAVIGSACSAMTTVGAPGSATAVIPSSSSLGTCSILHLTLKPVTLVVLGLKIKLDNCGGAAITVDITAVQGSLLGDILCACTKLKLKLAQLIVLLGALVSYICVDARLVILINFCLTLFVGGVLKVGWFALLCLFLNINISIGAGGGLQSVLLGGAIGVPLALGGVTIYMVRRKKQQRSNNEAKNAHQLSPVKDISVEA